jgi:UrcA family protein
MTAIMNLYVTARARAVCVSALLAALPISHVAMGATAESNYEVARRVVTFADLDITHDTGVAVLYSRIVTAARQVCDPPIFLYGDWRAVAHAARCFDEAVKRAVDEVDVPALTTYRLAKSDPLRAHY